MKPAVTPSVNCSLRVVDINVSLRLAAQLLEGRHVPQDPFLVQGGQ